MATFILTWNPTKWSWDDNGFAEELAESEAGLIVRANWSLGIRRSGVEPGDRGFLLRQHDLRGIVASGAFTTEIYMEDHWDGSGRDSPYAEIDWDRILAPEDRLPVEELKRRVPAVPWDRLQGSGVQVPEGSVGVLEQLWADHIDTVGWRSPEEETVEIFKEGDVARVEVSRYERDLKASAACIAHWGCKCQVCGLDFGKRYGRIGEGFIHVHHLTPLAARGRSHSVDPVADLRPVCPNCHAMLHQGSPPLAISALRRRLKRKPA